MTTTRPAQAELDARFLCVTCGVDTNSKTGIGEYYVVEDEIWEQTGLGKLDGMLCIGCLETAIGRQLTPDDFKDCCANLDQRSSQRLRDRRQRDGNDDLRALQTIMKALRNHDPYLRTIINDVQFYAGWRTIQ